MKKLLLLALVIAAVFTTCKDPDNPSAGEETYTISFDANGGSGGQTATVTAKYGKPMPVLSAQPPTRNDYFFIGYYDAQTDGTMYYKSDLTSAKNWDKKDAATLYAQWSLTPVTTITFNANEGNGTMPTQKIPEKTSANLTANTFTRTGYTFEGWAATASGTVTYTDGQSYTAADGGNSVPLYAVWKAKTYVINFVNTGGTGGQTGTVTATFGQPMPALTAPAPTSTTDGLLFTGYWDAASGGKKYYNANLTSAANWDKDANTTLYARFAPPSAVSANESVVSLVRSTEAQASSLAAATPENYNKIKALVSEAITLAGGLDGIVKAGDVVVLKPNIICTTYSWNAAANGAHIPETMNGVCTDWRVTQAVAEIVRAIVGPYNSATGKGKIMVIEGPGKGTTNTPSATSHHFTNVGYTLANLTAVDDIINLDTEGAAYSKGSGATQGAYSTQITLPDFVYKDAANNYLDYYKNDGKYWVNKKILEADVLISLPVVKSHWNATVTGAIKNIGIGTPPARIYGISATDVGRNNMVNHASTALQDWIVDYFSCLPADFVVMDGLQGLQNGPLPGGSTEAAALTPNQKNLRCILASKDPLAIDMVSTAIIGADYNTIPYLTKLTAKGQVYARGEIGKTNPRMIPLRGNAKDIVVLGNVKVDDVRGTYTLGVQAGNPGQALTAAQKTLPTVSINSAAFSGSNLDLALTLSNGANNNVVKIDVYIDEAYKKSFNTGMVNVSLDASSLAAGSHNIEVRAYTQFMSCATATTTADK